MAGARGWLQGQTGEGARGQSDLQLAGDGGGLARGC